MLRPLDARRPVAFFTNGLGDAFLNLPALRALVDLFPDMLTLICDDNAYQLCFSELPLRATVKVSTWDEGEDRIFDVPRVAAAVSGCDLFLSLVPWYSDSLQQLVKQLSPETSIGFFPQFDIALPRDYSKHAADLAFDIPKALDPLLSIDSLAAAPQFRPEVEREVQRICANLPAGSRVLAVHADTVKEKMWSPDKFVSVLDGFSQRHPEFFFFAVGRTQQPLDMGSRGSHVLPTYGLPLDISCCLVSHADLFLGIDSCMLHVADLCRVPGVGLFGATSVHEFGFRFGPHRHVCGAKGMENISVAAVFDALESLLHRDRPQWSA